MASELVNKSGSAPIYSFVITNHAYKRPNFGRDRESNSFDKVKSPSRTLRYPNEFLCFSLDEIDDFMYNFCDFGYNNGNILFFNKNYKKREPKKIIASCYANFNLSPEQRERANMTTIREESEGVDGASTVGAGNNMGGLDDTEIVETGTQGNQRISSTPLNPHSVINRGRQTQRDLGEHIANLTAVIQGMETRMNDMAREIGSQANVTNRMRNEFNDRLSRMVNVSSQDLVANNNNRVSVSNSAVSGPNLVGSGMPESVVSTDNQEGMAALATAIAMVHAASVMNNAGTSNLINNNPIMSTGMTSGPSVVSQQACANAGVNSVTSNGINLNNSNTQGISVSQAGQNLNLNSASNNFSLNAPQMSGGNNMYESRCAIKCWHEFNK